MARYNQDAIWESVSTGQFDEDGYEFSDYVLAGSEPLSPFEAMVLASAGAQLHLDVNPYLEHLS